jgi:hypothetical protein
VYTCTTYTKIAYAKEAFHDEETQGCCCDIGSAGTGGAVAYWAVAQRTSDPPDLAGFARHTVDSADGTAISYRSIGVGPA